MLLLLSNLLVLLVAYYVMKTVREPLVLATGGAELKSYAAAVQAGLLVGFVPAYGWLTSRVSRGKLVFWVVLTNALVLEAFYAAGTIGVRNVGFAFFVFVGIFSVASIALFWSYANDLYERGAGERLFPVVAIGATVGSPIGSAIAGRLFAAGVTPFELLHVAAGLLLVHLGLYALVEWRERRTTRAPAEPVPRGAGGFGLVLRSPFLRGLAGMLVLLNLVNTIGEYILSRSVLAAARMAASVDPALDVGAYIGAFYGRYFFWVNVAAVVLQALVVSRVVKAFGVRGAVLALPIVAFGAYGLVAAGAGLAAIRLAKTAENSVDYSLMNTGKQMLWLASSREEKYKAKQAIDTFFVRAGDVLAAGLVWIGTHRLSAGVTDFAIANLVLVVLWGATAWVVLARYRARCAECP